LSPPVPGRRCGGSWLRQLHITGCCTHARRSVRKLTPAGHACNPRYVLRPLRACAGIGSEYRAHARPMPMFVRTRGTGCARLMVRRAARAVIELAPARPPSAPRGGSLAPSTVLASVAPCSPRQGFAAPLRALDPAARGTPWTRPVAFAECLAPHTQGERHATHQQTHSQPHHAHAAA
jgi:hypothetical protein